MKDQDPSEHHRSSVADRERRCRIKSCQSLHRRGSRVARRRRPFRCVGTGEAAVVVHVCGFRGGIVKK